ncbi:MAG: hypothetical protein EBX39_07425 [Actinobacteria bacterium]|nr:hypothetical protein [Actinomycetota bacterium]
MAAMDECASFPPHGVGQSFDECRDVALPRIGRIRGQRGAEADLHTSQSSPSHDLNLSDDRVNERNTFRPTGSGRTE